MPPESGGICGRFPSDLPLSYLQGGRALRAPPPSRPTPRNPAKRSIGAPPSDKPQFWVLAFVLYGLAFLFDFVAQATKQKPKYEMRTPRVLSFPCPYATPNVPTAVYCPQ